MSTGGLQPGQADGGNQSLGGLTSLGFPGDDCPNGWSWLAGDFAPPAFGLALGTSPALIAFRLLDFAGHVVGSMTVPRRLVSTSSAEDYSAFDAAWAPRLWTTASLVKVLASLALAMLLLVVTPVVARADLGPRVDGCGDVRFVGVKGSGETGTYDDYGREMETLSRELELAMPDWVTFKSTPVNYPAYGVELLLPLGFNPGLYVQGLHEGDKALRSLLKEVEEECPDEVEILGGYSSGALIVHDILDEVQASDHWRTHIGGVHLLADPRRDGYDLAAKGGAVASSFGIAGIGNLLIDVSGIAVIPSAFAPVTKSWCVSRDPICAVTPGTLAFVYVNKERHENYGLTILPKLFNDEAARFARPFEYRFPPVNQSLPRTAVGWPVVQDLKDGFSHPVRFAGISPAIPGLKLSSTGILSGTPTTTGRFTPTVTAVTSVGGTTHFELELEIVEPFEMVDFEPDAQVLPPMVVHQPVDVHVPTVPAGSVVTLEPQTELPVGLHLSTGGRLQGKPDVVGDSTVGVRVAEPNGTLRRFRLELRVVNPAVAVSAAPDGTLADADVSEGVMLDDSRVAFVSFADNLGVPNPGFASVVYVKDTTGGALADWVPPEGEGLCSLITDPAKSHLYIVTTSSLEVTNGEGEAEYEPQITVRQLPLSGHTYPTGGLSPTSVVTFKGTCNAGSPVAALPNGILDVISASRLDLPGEPEEAAQPPERLYMFQGGKFKRVGGPSSNALPWSPAAISDVRTDGTLLVSAQRIKVGTVEELGELEKGYFALEPNGAWAQVDVDGAGETIAMSTPRFYAGGVVFGVERKVPVLNGDAVKPYAVRAPEGELRYKPLRPSDPVAFDSLDVNAFGIQPLTANDYAAGCATYSRTKLTHVEPTTVFYESTEIDSCIASEANGASPFSASGMSRMLVTGHVNGTRELLIAGIP